MNLKFSDRTDLVYLIATSTRDHIQSLSIMSEEHGRMMMMLILMKNSFDVLKWTLQMHSLVSSLKIKTHERSFSHWCLKEFPQRKSNNKPSLWILFHHSSCLFLINFFLQDFGSRLTMMNKKKISLYWFRTFVPQVVVSRGRKRTCAQVKPKSTSIRVRRWMPSKLSMLLERCVAEHLFSTWSIRWISRKKNDQVAKSDIYLQQPHQVRTYLERIEATSVDWHPSWSVRRLLKRRNITSRSSLSSKKRTIWENLFEKRRQKQHIVLIDVNTHRHRGTSPNAFVTVVDLFFLRTDRWNVEWKTMRESVVH